MDIVKFAYQVDNLYKRSNAENFAAFVLGIFIYLSLFLTPKEWVMANYHVTTCLLLLFITHRCTSGIRENAKRKKKHTIVDLEYVFNKNQFIKFINAKTINSEIITEEKSTEQKIKRAYVSSPAPQGELLPQDAANLLGVRPTVLTLLRKYKREAEEYNISTDDSYGPSPIQKRKNGRVTYLESEILRHSKLFQEGTLRYITEAQHYDRIKNHNIK